MSRAPLLILLAVGDDDMRAYLRSVVGRLGDVRVVEASDGREALRTARALLPDLILADEMLPRLSGDGLCRALRDAPETAHVGLILVSGETRSRLPCADGSLAEPFSARALRTEVQRVLSPSVHDPLSRSALRRDPVR